MGFLKQINDTDVECHVCNGNGIDKQGYITLLTVCHQCSVHGWVDWAAGAVKGSKHRPETDKEMQLRVAHQNIHTLRHKIIDIGMEAGFHLVVNIETINLHEHVMTMHPPLIKIGGT